jgi:hypothetical protein
LTGKIIFGKNFILNVQYNLNEGVGMQALVVGGTGTMGQGVARDFKEAPKYIKRKRSSLCLHFSLDLACSKENFYEKR